MRDSRTIQLGHDYTEAWKIFTDGKDHIVEPTVKNFMGMLQTVVAFGCDFKDQSFNVIDSGRVVTIYYSPELNIWLAKY